MFYSEVWKNQMITLKALMKIWREKLLLLDYSM